MKDLLMILLVNSLIGLSAGLAGTIPPKDFMLQLIERKKYEVAELERQHSSPTDPVKLRTGYISDLSSLKLTRALRLFTLGEETRRISVVGDLKRLSPTAPDMPRTVGTFADAGQRADDLFAMGVNIMMVNTDEYGWGGSPEDLSAVTKAKREREKQLEADGVKGSPLAVVCKDLIVNPIQIGAALERGCDGVLLLASVLGPRLENLLDACTIMGTEAIVEVHTPNEAKYALELGAMIMMVNNWDRTDGTWHPDQAEAVRRVIPDNVVTIATGGIGSSDQARALSDAGFDSVCLGRALEIHPDPKQLVRNIRNFEAPPLLAGVNG